MSITQKKSWNIDSIEELVTAANQAESTISYVVLQKQALDMEETPEVLYERMKNNFQVMIHSVEEGCQKDLTSTSGLTGGEAYRMSSYRKSGHTIGGSFFTGVLERALAVSCSNAAMGRIVAAPTAGSCGILPAVILSAAEAHGYSEKSCVMALFTASAFGMVIAKRASIAGASGGCQAECGSASAMAAAALVELAGGTPSQSSHAAAIALKSILGMVCDPVAGLVEIPCIKRNATGAVNALAAAEMAMAGITSAIPADEVILAMKRIGDAMSPALKETAEGGLATTPTGIHLAKQILNS